ncbi:MAG TPA: hypothetical protein VLL08_21915 [Kineosporiaceae bacterium]|nr:hypothetical protein [Kineosporiaceae bacterium]
MSAGLVREVNGRIVFGDTVARVAESLHPLGPIARMVTEAAAMGVELRRLTLQGHQIEADRLVGLARLENRQIEAGATIQGMHRTVANHERTARELRQCLVNLQRDMLKSGLSRWQQELYGDLMRDVMAQLNANHAIGGQTLTGNIHEILNGEGALAPGSLGSTAPRGSRSGSSQPSGPAGSSPRPRRRRPR